VRYVPKGFGAHHWQVVDEHGPVLFATHDQVGDPQGQDLPASARLCPRPVARLSSPSPRAS
jgi:hypothetical protein